MVFGGSRVSIRHRRRRGAALVELAMCLPVFFALAIGTVEVCRLLYLRQSLKITAFECARLGIVPGVPEESLVDQCDMILGNRRIVGYRLSHEPSELDTLEFGDDLTVTITAPVEQNLLLGRWFYQSEELRESVALAAEY